MKGWVILLALLVVACGAGAGSAVAELGVSSGDGGGGGGGGGDAAQDVPAALTCSPGSYAASATSCAACPSGHFSAAVNASRCTSWRDCAPGSFVTEPGTDTRDRACALCAEGTESTSANQAACTPKGTCAAGTALRPGGGPSDCEACEAGEYCAGAGATRVACAAGTWDHDSDPATPCADATR